MNICRLWIRLLRLSASQVEASFSSKILPHSAALTLFPCCFREIRSTKARGSGRRFESFSISVSILREFQPAAKLHGFKPPFNGTYGEGRVGSATM